MTKRVVGKQKSGKACGVGLPEQPLCPRTSGIQHQPRIGHVHHGQIGRQVSETFYLEHGKLKRFGDDCPSEPKTARWNLTNSTIQCEIVSILLLGG